MKHVIGTYSSVTDAVICMKNPIYFRVVYCNWVSTYYCTCYSYFILMSEKTYLPTHVSEVHMAWYYIHFYLRVTESWRGSQDSGWSHWILGPGGSVIPRIQWPGVNQSQDWATENVCPLQSNLWSAAQWVLGSSDTIGGVTETYDTGHSSYNNERNLATLPACHFIHISDFSLCNMVLHIIWSIMHNFLLYNKVKNREVFSAEWLVCQILWHNTDEYVQQFRMSTNMAMIYKMQSGF